MNSLKNIVFDLGGVLIDLDIQRCIDAFNALGMPQVVALLNPYYPADILSQLERGILSAHEACDEMRRMSGRSEVTDEQIAQAYAQFLIGIPIEKLRLVKALRERGFKTYALSNSNRLVMPYIRDVFFTADSLTMNDYFDKIYLSFEMQELKPGAIIFEKMIADSHMKPEETLFIDDGEQNVATAHDLGFQVYMPSPREDFGHLFDNMNIK